MIVRYHAPRSPDRLRVGVDVRCLVDGELRGWARYTLELVEALACRPSLDVVALAHEPVPFDLPVPVRLVPGGREVWREQIALVRVAAREDLDVLLAPANRGLPWATPCATVLTIHDAVEWDSELVTPPRGMSRLRFAYASVLSLASADLLITVSQASKSRIRDRLAVREHRLRVVYEAASARFMADPEGEAVERLCGRLGLPAGFVLYLGGFDRKKDVATLLRAVARMVRGGDDITLVAAGAGNAERALLEDHAARLGVGSSVHWVGFVPDDDLPALYRAASCFVFPAIAEGFGLPAVEAMACGTPVIAARAAALPEVVGQGGLLFTPGDDAELAELIRSVLDASVPERQALVDRARERARTFSWEHTAEATERVLREAAAAPSAWRWYRRMAELGLWRHRLPPRGSPSPRDDRSEDAARSPTRRRIVSGCVEPVPDLSSSRDEETEMNPVDRPLQQRYWEFLRLRDTYLDDPTPALPWWMSGAGSPLNPTETTIFDFVSSVASVVDIGAGDGRIENKLRRFGFAGSYSTVDTSSEFAPDYSSVEELPTSAFEAALLLEVIEHVPLAAFDEFMDHVLRCLTPGARLAISTPNAAYIGSIWEADMTHVHAYRLQDLAAYLHLRGFDCRLFRVSWQPQHPTMLQRLRLLSAKVVARWILQLDYARGALLLAQRRS